jgi:hypothetical protein
LQHNPKIQQQQHHHHHHMFDNIKPVAKNMMNLKKKHIVMDLLKASLCDRPLGAF